jgi:hypothetical protein
MLQGVYWTNAEARTNEGGRENVTVIMWDWDVKQGKAVLDSGPHRIIDVYMTDYCECDLTIGVKHPPVPNELEKGGNCGPL